MPDSKRATRGGARSRPQPRPPSEGTIRVGIGGWLYPPWRGVFYPKDLPHAAELEYASRAVTAIEINATYHRLQSPASFAKWAATAPPGFVFTVKASFVCTNRKNLAEVAPAIERFFAQGVTGLGEKLGPILWQLMPTKRFVPDEIREFLALLPAERDGIALRHALEVRHESFLDPELVDIARRAGVAIVFADSPDYAQIADCTGSFVYARLRNSQDTEPLGYSATALKRYAAIARDWAAGRHPPSLPYLGESQPEGNPRDVFVFFIDGAKERAPAAAQALLAQLTPERAATASRKTA